MDLSKGIVVCPLLSFYFLFFSFSLFFGGLNGSFYLTLICPLWDLLLCPLWDLFLTYGQHSILQEGKGDLSHFTRYSKHKEDVTIMMYAMYASASVAEYAMIVVRHVAIIRARPN